MKKLLALLLVLAMIFTLAACGEGDKKPEKNKTEGTSASDEKTEPSESESTEPSESESTEPSESESTEPSESESTEPSESESTAPSEEEPTVDPTVPSEDEPAAPEGIDPDLIGTWAGTVNMTGEMMELPEMDAVLPFSFTMAFDTNNLCMLTIDEDAMRESLPEFLEAMVPFMVEAFYEEMGGKEAAEEAMMEMMGMTVTEFYESMITEEEFYEGMFSSLEEANEIAAYYIQDGQIVIDEEGVDYVIQGDKLILSGGALYEGLEQMGVDSLELTLIDASEPFIPEPEAPGKLDSALFGTWAGSITVDGSMMDMPDLDATLAVDLTMSFGEDGVCFMEIDEAALRESAALFLEEVIPYMVQMVYDEAGGQEAADEAMMESMGMTVEEYCESLITEDMFVEMIMGSLDENSAEMEYYVANGLLYIGDTSSEYTIEGDELMLFGGDLAEGLEEMGLDRLELTKVD